MSKLDLKAIERRTEAAAAVTLNVLLPAEAELIIEYGRDHRKLIARVRELEKYMEGAPTPEEWQEAHARSELIRLSLRPIACVNTRMLDHFHPYRGIHPSDQCIGWPHDFGPLSEELTRNVCAKP